MNNIKILEKDKHGRDRLALNFKKKRLLNYFLKVPYNKRKFSRIHFSRVDKFFLCLQAFLTDSFVHNPTQAFSLVCRRTGRTKSIISNYYVSRLTFKKLSRLGMLPGITRASW